MNYIKVNWAYSGSTKYPVVIYSEIDDQRWETRKVEVFPDGDKGYACSTESAGSTELGIEPLPALSDIASDLQFELIEITKEEFEDVWAKRKIG
jgi:hypothetical protein